MNSPSLLQEVRTDVKGIMVQVSRITTILEDIPEMKSVISELKQWRANAQGRLWGIGIAGMGGGGVGAYLAKYLPSLFG